MDKMDDAMCEKASHYQSRKQQKKVPSLVVRLMNAFWWKSKGSNSKGIRWCAWDKISMSKKKGGLGFRNIQGFNMALLGDSSYTLSGMWEVKESMKHGLRWVLGDGQSVNIKSDRWLKGPQDFRVNRDHTSVSSTAKSPSHGALKVNVDAAVTEGQNYFAVGMVLRNNQGQFLTRRVKRFAGYISVVEAEMVGVIETISWIDQIQVSQVIVETDSQLCQCNKRREQQSP
ncbi:hypothetical protein AgCh_038472 [Apium graveolens]